MTSTLAPFRPPATLALPGGDLVSKRREQRYPTLPYRAIVTGRAFRYPVGCSLRNRSDGGVLLELEPAHTDDPVAMLQRKAFIWIYFCTDEVWHEAMVRWRRDRQFGVSFISDPLPSPPLAWSRDGANAYRYRQVMAMAGRPHHDPKVGR